MQAAYTFVIEMSKDLSEGRAFTFVFSRNASH